MYTNKKMAQRIAWSFLMLFVHDLLAPTVSWALTSGPTAPEATSFEPVDTSDMVNLSTGDFTYNIPMLEVPGPSGGYPLSLSYHAGIQPLEESSWIGLGWNLNPGAITRIVNGYPDDHDSVNNAQRTFWEGGETETKTVGISVGVGNTATVSAGLSFSQDTYRGYGIGGYIGASFGNQLFEGSKVGVGGGAQLSFMDYNGDSDRGRFSAGGSVGISLGESLSKDLGFRTGLNLNFNTNSGFSGGASARITSRDRDIRGSLLDASISTNGNGARGNVGVGGGTASVNNAQSGKVSTRSNGFAVDVPIVVVPAVNLRLSRNYTRYWIDELANVSTYGALYTPDYNANTPLGEFTNSAFDTYDLPDLLANPTVNKNNAKMVGGTFADYDIYSVSGQGVSGNIRPYHFQQTLHRQNQESGNQPTQVYNYPIEGPNKKPHFRFVGDFSNHYSYKQNKLYVNFISGKMGYDFDQNVPEVGDKDDTSIQPISGDNQLVGSKHVQHLTNTEIKNGAVPVGFVDATAFPASKRPRDEQIGAFMVTNESGVTYHYALPAYSFNEWTYSQNTDDKNKKSFNSMHRPERYAYTWYLTAITGPDFVDRNNDHLLDEGDWGYWVAFDYGLWADRYAWRNPAEGFHRDLDTRFINYTKGEKELYYLNYVRTKSHTAIFSKSIRKDAKGVVHEFDDKAVAVTSAKAVSRVDEGGFNSKMKTVNYGDGEFSSRFYPISTLKLEQAYLVSNKDFPKSARESLLRASNRYQHQIGNTNHFFHQGNNVVDIYDVANAFDIDKTIRSVRLNTDYSLTQGMPNSYESQVDLIGTGEVEDTGKKGGRLTLKAIDFLGKGGANRIPNIQFGYAKNPDYKKEMSDIWGFYKSDANPALIAKNDTEGKAVSRVSAAGLDAWSLTSILSPLGATINIQYEPDTYRLPPSHDNVYFNVVDANRVSSSRVSLTFEDGFNAPNHFKAGDRIDYHYLFRRARATYLLDCFSDEQGNCFDNITCTYTQSGGDRIDNVPKSNSAVITQVNDQSIVVDDGGWAQDLRFETLETNHMGPNCPQSQSAYSGEHLSGVIARSGTSQDILGGGLRVAKVSVTHMGKQRSTLYDYNVDGHTSGLTTYEPTKIEKVLLASGEGDKSVFFDGVTRIDDDGNPVVLPMDDGTRTYLRNVYGDRMDRILAIARDIPGPGVFYSRVTVREEVKESRFDPPQLVPQYVVYDFEAYDQDMVKPDDILKFPTYELQGKGDIKYVRGVQRVMALHDFSSRLGTLKRHTLYSDNGQKVSETVNEYLYDEFKNLDYNDFKDDYAEAIKERYGGLGILEETFLNMRIARQGKDGLLPEIPENKYYLIGMLNKRVHYPNIKLRTVNINHKLGITTVDENLQYDFYSGQAVKTRSTDSHGNIYETLVTPAYRKYPKMGPGAINGGKNMLAQQAATQVYALNPMNESEVIGVVSATAQTWSDQVRVLGATPAEQANIWRKSAAFSWKGDDVTNLSAQKGLYPNDRFVPFDAWAGGSAPSSSQWQKNGQITLYDPYSHALEATDINSNYAATQMGVAQEVVVATAANARYDELVYSGLEQATNLTLDNKLYIGSGSIVYNSPSRQVAHTGKAGVQVGRNAKTLIFNSGGLDKGKAYRVSVWTDNPFGKVYYRTNGGEHQYFETNPDYKSGSWYLIKGDIVLGANDNHLEVGCLTRETPSAVFDDFRLHPADAAMTSYVYNQWGELSHILDANNLFTEYKYDGMGRLVNAYRESFRYGKVMTSKNVYHYAR